VNGLFREVMPMAVKSNRTSEVVKKAVVNTPRSRSPSPETVPAMVAVFGSPVP
jgi:hypothetical protein